MTRMRIRELSACRDHRRAIIVLEDISRRVTLTFYADPDEARRLAQELQRGRRTCHPVYDFVGGLFRAFEATPSRVVLDDVNGEGIGGTVYVRVDAAEIGVPCYPPDALALALRTNVPIFASAGALDHGEPTPPSEAGDAVGGWLERLRPEDFG